MQLSRYSRVGATYRGSTSQSTEESQEAWSSFPEYSFSISSLKLEVVKREAREWKEYVFQIACYIFMVQVGYRVSGERRWWRLGHCG